jgi:hypothetical protein
MAAEDEQRGGLQRLALNDYLNRSPTRPATAQRDANERVMRAVSSSAFQATDRVSLACECGAPICREIVTLTIEEYQDIRAHPTWFLLAPGHEDQKAAPETTVGAGNGYVVVEEIGSADAAPERRDPRASTSG